MRPHQFEPRDFSIHLQHDEREAVAVLYLQGDLGEMGAYAEMKHGIAKIPATVNTIILHLGGLDYINTLAVGAIVAANVRANKDGKRLSLCCPPEKIRAILEMSGILHLVPLFASLDEARACAPQTL